MPPKLGSLQWIAKIVLVTVVSVIPACGDSDSPVSPGSPPGELATALELSGSASARAGSQSLECDIDFIVELSEEVARNDVFVEYDLRFPNLRPRTGGAARPGVQA